MQRTDLLFGIVSNVPNEDSKHFFLADFDNISEKEIKRKVGKILFDKYNFGPVYVMKTGKGYHLLCFSVKLSLRKYVKILKEVKADSMFIEWVSKVKYGVLRLSRRSTHLNVPYLAMVLFPDYRYEEYAFCKDFYFSTLKIEDDIREIVRVKVR
jgi:hypothetical protein